MAEFYKTDTGYVLKDNIWSITNQEAEILELSNLTIGDESASVRLLQNSLKSLNFYNNEVTGIYDEDTYNSVARFQTSKGLRPTGNTDQYTWTIIQESLGKLQSEETGFVQEFTKNPGDYPIDWTDVFNSIKGFKCRIRSNNTISVKRTCMVFYEDDYVGYLSNVKEVTDEEFDLEDMQNAFIYNVKHGNPVKVEYVIYPYGRMPYKFIFK